VGRSLNEKGEENLTKSSGEPVVGASKDSPTKLSGAKGEE